MDPHGAGSTISWKRLASAGIPRTDVEVKIFGPEERELGPGEMGKIVTRSDLVMKVYGYGKILKRELRARFWEARDRKV